MASFHEKLNDWLIPAALGAVLYFLQTIAHDNQDFSRNIAILVTRIDAYERRIAQLEKDQCPR